MKMGTREVASGVVNLGNTCYMNAVFQALAHAPELCMAIECEPHLLTCPIATSNADYERRLTEDTSASTANGIDNNQSSPTMQHVEKERIKLVKASDECEGIQFCLLCEIEKHLTRVHSGSMNSVLQSRIKAESLQRNESIYPSTLVNGFFDHIAPSNNFKIGLQQDSHEFLRLLIDGMQNSCINARPNQNGTNKSNGDGEDPSQSNKSNNSGGEEYAFKLFRGTVESTIKCSQCGASSVKIDPIEDIGLDVTSASKNNGYSMSSPLYDIIGALNKFIEEEKLDVYKCEKCNKRVCASKTTRLASIPPILTLHLKRFRFGANGNSSHMAYQPTFSTRRVNSKSGSQKIDGFVKFEQILDIHPYVTEELQQNKKKIFCRLFAVVVHSGKNSHSGHYIAYVRNLSKNEWWKMDDAKVTRVAQEEVINCEAYMLFYRVVEHPIAQGLRKAEAIMKEEAAKKAKEESVKAKEQEQMKQSKTSNSKENGSTKATGNKRKRNEVAFTSCKEWAKQCTQFPESCIPIFENAVEALSHNMEFKPEYFRLIKEDADKGGDAGSGPRISLSIDEDVRDVHVYKKAIMDLLVQYARDNSSDLAKFLNDDVPDS